MSSSKDKINIRLSSMTDLPKINQLYKEVVYDINNVKRINMLWNNEYPFYILKNDINNKEMHIIEVDDKIIGTFSLSIFDNPEYHVINWSSNNKKYGFT